MTQEAGFKNNLRRLILWAGLIMILLLMGLSIYATFIGAQAASRFFNSIPLSVYWVVFGLLLVAAIMTFKRLLHTRGLFLIHLGCMLVLAGGIWGSRAGLKIQDGIFGTDTIRSGQMVIYEGETEKAVAIEDGSQKELPFAIKLVDFKIQYYSPGNLIIRTQDGRKFKFPAVPDRRYPLGDDLGSVEIVRRFENFKILLESAKRTAIDDPNVGGLGNPALEIRVTQPDSSQTIRYAFERSAGHTHPDDKLTFYYRRMIRDYISDLEVIKDAQVVAKKSIEVNKPLHFDSFLFYQQGYDDESGRYTVLSVVSDKGLSAVYLGYILLCAGIFWHFWLRYLFGDRIIED